MVIESTMICVDNSEYMRNEDVSPTRMKAQQDAVHMLCVSKTASNPENRVGLLTLANTRVLAALTGQVGHLITKLQPVQPAGNVDVVTALKIANLALNQTRGQRDRHDHLRIVLFIGSPLDVEQHRLVRLAKHLRSSHVNVDVVSFAEESLNMSLLTSFVEALNGRCGSGSHLVNVSPGYDLLHALVSSPVLQGARGVEGFIGTNGSFLDVGIQHENDPELALALMISLEEQVRLEERAAKRAEARFREDSEEEMIARALAMSKEAEQPVAVSADEAKEPPTIDGAGSAMEVEGSSGVSDETRFLQNILENLPGVDPMSELVQQAVGSSNKNKEFKKN